MALSSVEEIIEDLRQGHMVIIMDDEDRENEGDLVMAAPMVRGEHINFMAKHGRGLICMTLTAERCKQLRLPLMVDINRATHATNFTVSIEAAEGVTTGISAQDRAHTVRVAVAPEARPDDLVQPGHIFPLMAEEGGVLTRAGHTEAGCDLVGLAGMEPSAVIVEILNEDGSMARRPDLELFASRHGLRIGTIADLIRYRVMNEKTIERVAECRIETDFGPFSLVTYQDTIDKEIHMALIRGELKAEDPVLVRVHLPDTLRDLLYGDLRDGSRPLRSALQRVAEEGSGVVVILAHREAPNELVRRIRMLGLQQDASRTPALGGRESTALRSYGIGAQILRDLGVRKMRVLSVPKRIHAISGFGLDVVDYVS